MTMNAFSGSTIDRAGGRRADREWVAERLNDPSSRAIVLTDGAVVVRGERLERLPLDVATRAASAPPLLLGLEDGAALFAVDAPAFEAAAADDDQARVI